MVESGNRSHHYLFQKGITAFQRGDYATALREFKRLAKQGLAPAQYNLGLTYANGRGVPQHYKTAVKWYRLAAEQGNANAQNNLGMLYAFGDGVPKDYVRAHMWGNIAISIGGKNKGKVRDLVEKKMTPSQLEKAQDLARECIRNKYKGCLVELHPLLLKDLKSTKLIPMRNLTATLCLLNFLLLGSIGKSSGASELPYWAGHQAVLFSDLENATFDSECNLSIVYSADGKQYSASVDLPERRHYILGKGQCKGAVDKTGALQRQDCTPGIISQRDIIGTVLNPILDNPEGGRGGRCSWADQLLRKKRDLVLAKNDGGLLSQSGAPKPVPRTKKNTYRASLDRFWAGHSVSLNEGSQDLDISYSSDGKRYDAVVTSSNGSFTHRVKGMVDAEGTIERKDAGATRALGGTVLEPIVFHTINGDSTKFRDEELEGEMAVLLAEKQKRTISEALAENLNRQLEKRLDKQSNEDKVKAEVKRRAQAKLDRMIKNAVKTNERDLERRLAEQKSSPPFKSTAEKEVERLRKEIARLKKQKKSQPKQVAKKPSPKKSPPPSSGSTGSGFFVSKLGHIITSEHVVRQCGSVTVGDNANKQVTASVIETDNMNDLALLRISSTQMASAETKTLISKLTVYFAPLASKGLFKLEDVELGEDILVAGFPHGDFYSDGIKVTKGIVSGKKGMGDDRGQFQMDAAVQKGNSGGPIYDENGNIVGVVVAQLNKLKVAKAIGSLPENVNFGIKASTVRQFLTSAGIPTKRSNRKQRKSFKEVAQIAKNQTVMVICNP